MPSPSRAPRPDSSGSTSIPLALVVGIDAILRDAVVADFLLDDPTRAALRYDITADGSLHRVVISAAGIHGSTPVELEHACLSCAMREDVVPVLRALAADARWSGLVLALPVASDPSTVAPALQVADPALHITSVTAVLDSSTAYDDLLGDDLLADRLLRWGVEDERAVGEALAAQIAYADVLIDAADGPASAGTELVEHLRAGEQMPVRGIHQVDTGRLLTDIFDPVSARRRIDPCTVQPWGGGQEFGTWTLDLVSERPLHPERFLQYVEQLGTGRLRSRGRLWFPTRPDSICQWDGAGGQVSIGTIAHTHRCAEDQQADVRACLSADGLPTTRLVVTGVDPEDQARVERAFAACLLTEEEWARGLAPWLGRADRLSPWLGERTAA